MKAYKRSISEGAWYHTATTWQPLTCSIWKCLIICTDLYSVVKNITVAIEARCPGDVHNSWGLSNNFNNLRWTWHHYKKKIVLLLLMINFHFKETPIMSIQHLFKCSASGGTYLEVNTFNRPSLFATYICNMHGLITTTKWQTNVRGSGESSVTKYV